jgi:hypothetical protein
LLDTLPSDAARRRVLAAADVGVPPDADHRSERVAELDPAARRQVAAEVRFTGHDTVFYRQIPAVETVDITAEIADDTGGYGGRVATTVAEGNHVAVVCAVPETGSHSDYCESLPPW